MIPILVSEALYAYASPDRLPEDQREAFATWLNILCNWDRVKL